MKTIEIDIEKLAHPEKNVRVHPEHQIAEFSRALKMFGQTRPVVIDEKNTILAGNGLVMAMKANGEKKVFAIRYDNLSAKEKKKLMMSDNRIFELGSDNRGNTNDFLAEFAGVGDFDIPGFDEEIIKMLTATPEEIDEQLRDYGNEISERSDAPASDAPKATAPVLETGMPKEEGEQIRCPHCGEQVWL